MSKVITKKSPVRKLNVTESSKYLEELLNNLENEKKKLLLKKNETLPKFIKNDIMFLILYKRNYKLAEEIAGSENDVRLGSQINHNNFIKRVLTIK